MSGLRRAVRHPDRTSDPHVRAHALASDRLLEPILPADAAWLETHLERCANCRQFATEIAADRDLFAGLRGAEVMPPRDLGARLAGALDAEVQAAIQSGRRVPGRRPAPTDIDARRDRRARQLVAEERSRALEARSATHARRVAPPARPAVVRRSGRPPFALVGIAAAAVVALLALPVLTSPLVTPPAANPPTAPGSSVAGNPGPTPMRVGAGPVAFVRRNVDGRYSIAEAPVDEVCPGADVAACGTYAASPRTIVTLDIADPTAVLMGRDGDTAVVVSRDAIYAVSMPPAAGSSPAITAAQTAEPTISPVASPAETGVPASPPTGTPVPSGPPATSAAATLEPSPSPGGSIVATETATPEPSLAATVEPSPGATDLGASPTPGSGNLQSPTPTPPASDAPATPDVSPSAAPTADPGASPRVTDAPTPEVTIPPATPAPTAARTLAIAEGVVVMGAAAAYSPDGTWVAFSARPAVGGGGPDVYAWRVGSKRADAITNDGASQFAGWFGDRILVSRTVVGGEPAGQDADPAQVQAETRLVDPATGASRLLGGRGWRPVVDPTHAFVASWRGTFAWSSGDHAWMPERGHLVIASWIALRDGSGDVADDVPWSGSIADSADWAVRWDPSGRLLAVWIADGQGQPTGRLSLFRVGADGRLDTAPVKEAAALESFSLNAERLAWATPPGKDGQGGRLTIYAWTANGDGHLESNPDPDGFLVAP